MTHLNSKTSNRQPWRVKALAIAVLLGFSGTVAQADTISRKPVGDLEIYKAATPGTATIFMMLDTSGSMSYITSDYGSCDTSYESQPSERIRAVVYNRLVDTSAADGLLRDENGNTIKDLTDSYDEITFTPVGCVIDGTMRFDRLTRLKIALIELLADEVYDANGALKDTGSVSDDYEIGLGNYSYQGDGKSGVVLVPTRALTAAQRMDLIEKTEDLQPTGGTPTAHALAEAGAYMMGTTTLSDVKVLAEREIRSNRNEWRRCNTNGNSNTLTFDPELNIYVYDCNSWGNWSTSSGSTTSGILSGYNAASNIDHADNGRTYFAGDNSDSGFIDSVASSKDVYNNKYLSPLNPNECSGNGIYLLTDGEPNNSSNTRAKTVMNTSLLGSSSSLSVTSCSALTGGSSSGAWGCMAEYAASLRNTANNPLNLEIKTATVGFGTAFAGLTGKRTITVKGNSKEVTDCDSGSANNDTRNLCKLGEKKDDDETKTFGNGGFYYTEESADIAASIVDFAADLVNTINTAPSGTITIPNDPYRTANQLPFAYLPMLDPDIASGASIWRGNLKKYNLDQGTLFGNSDRPLYKDVAGELDEDTQDVWQTSNFRVNGSNANNDITAGGVYAQLQAPNAGLGSVRTLYVEDDTSTTDTTPVLRRLSVNGSGRPQGFDQLKDTTTYSQLNKRRLLAFLGFNNVLTNDGQPTDTTDVESLILSIPTTETKVLGGVVHSKPTAISYGATLDTNGRIIDPRDDYALFGSMDGALHLVDADNGEEAVAIIPKYMMEVQPKALVDGSTIDKIGQPYFGVDAPWLVTTDYTYDLDITNPRVTVDTSAGKGMFAYGGLRMGGEAFYGMDITDVSAPEILFTITADGRNDLNSTKRRFTRLGQIWSKPTEAKIRWRQNQDPIDVLVFGGGYDMNYEEDTYVPTSSAPAKGNAIYMINAETGRLLWSTTNENGVGRNTKTDDMIHSITGEITVLDRDNDGLMDHLYAADLGGQVFRADFENARPAANGFTQVNNFSNKGVTRILDVAPSSNANKKYAYRFYERPVVSFYRNEGIVGENITNNGQLFALVNVISGNRSAPLSTLRNDNDFANRVYGIIDTDITNTDVLSDGFSPTVEDITESDLTALATALGTAPTTAVKTTAKANMIRGTSQGWYYPLTRFDGYNNVRYNKGVGDSAVINNLLYTTVYNPDKQYNTSVASCAAQITGGSERQLYCLPYGICMDDTSISGTGGYIPAGQGIQELTLGAYNDANTDVKVLIGTTTLTERIDAANRENYGNDGSKDTSNIKDLYPGETVRPTVTGGDGSAAEFLFNERYTLQPQTWYKRTQ
ncbi:PilC/PilY family type IV pilus protein [Psychrobacter fozii]|uniref:Type IV pilus assembly protein PilY1 n=1 Tax=Psychrobacter fozii TaxID=198480 RepID=A0A2V4UPD6_9GAMM|nr:PilC/PilY family type IV pilus protein [Psychrobacter fozii]PYE40879.1 type IV pilus assembly protein PilY1 [Psychrobacter fozii]